ncbi:MAG: hypothetical protein JW849_02490 [Phycisphaerae bacterium]|nr:hypothetical protein [Phycisphaerae bacterium]
MIADMLGVGGASGPNSSGESISQYFCQESVWIFCADMLRKRLKCDNAGFVEHKTEKIFCHKGHKELKGKKKFFVTFVPFVANLVFDVM